MSRGGPCFKRRASSFLIFLNAIFLTSGFSFFGARSTSSSSSSNATVTLSRFGFRSDSLLVLVVVSGAALEVATIWESAAGDDSNSASRALKLSWIKTWILLDSSCEKPKALEASAKRSFDSILLYKSTSDLTRFSDTGRFMSAAIVSERRATIPMFGRDNMVIWGKAMGVWPHTLLNNKHEVT